MAQRSNRDRLIEGTLACLAELPLDQITSRAIAERSGANVASIGYHFGSKDGLISSAAVAGLDRWLTIVATQLHAINGDGTTERIRHAARIISSTREQHRGLARAYLVSIALAQHDDHVQATLAAGIRGARPALASVLGLDTGAGGAEAAGLLLAMFHGLLLAEILDPGLAIEGDSVAKGLTRIAAEVVSVPQATT
jgi:AcrR family transcriptional regulator